MTDAFILGVDGCPKGWLAVRLFPHKEYPQRPDLRLFETFRDLTRSDWGQAALIMVDIPIGLAETGRRGCDTDARRLLGPKRGTSVFPAPRRAMLQMETWEQANAWGIEQGPQVGGISRQTWGIVPKINEVDVLITPRRQLCIREGHPEVAFHRLNGHVAVRAPKKDKVGAEQRRSLLYRDGVCKIEEVWQKFKFDQRRKVANEDDFFDACALASTGIAIMRGSPVHHLSEGKRDARGLIMEIWG